MTRRPRPLSQHALRALADLARMGQVARSLINPGISTRLHRDGLAVEVQSASPFGSHKLGALVPHLQITDAGRELLASRRNADG